MTTPHDRHLTLNGAGEAWLRVLTRERSFKADSWGKQPNISVQSGFFFQKGYTLYLKLKPVS